MRPIPGSFGISGWFDPTRNLPREEGSGGPDGVGGSQSTGPHDAVRCLDETLGECRRKQHARIRLEQPLP